MTAAGAVFFKVHGECVIGLAVDQFCENNLVRGSAVADGCQSMCRRLVNLPAEGIEPLREQQRGVHRGFLSPQVFPVHRAVLAQGRRIWRVCERDVRQIIIADEGIGDFVHRLVLSWRYSR